MAIKFKLSDEEKKKINKIATAMEEEKQTTRDTSSSQELPTASSKMKRKDDQKIYELPKAGFIANSRRTGEISNPFSDSRLINTLKKENETLKTAKEDLQPLGESSISSQTYEDMKSNDPKVSFPAKTRYLIDTAKGAITGWGKSIGQYLQTSVADDNQRVLDNKILAKFTDENGRKRLKETNKNLVEQIRKTQADKNADAIARQELSPTMQTLGDISRSLGNVAPTMALNAIIPGAGNVAMFMSSSGNASGEALLRENDIRKAKLAGDLKGAIEVGAEKLTGGIKFLPKGTLDNTAVNFISKNIKSKVGQKIASKGYEVGGEVLEEVLTDIGQNTVDKFMYQDDGKVVDFDQLKETAKITVLTTLALNALGLGGSTYKEVQQQNKTNEVNSRINEAQKVINGDGYITQEQQTSSNTNVEQNFLPTVNTENTYSNQLKQMASKEITNSNISEDYKTMMLDVLNNMSEVSDADVGSIRQNINSLEEANRLDTKIDSKNDQTRRKKYMQYKNDTNIYDSTEVNEVLDMTPTNRNGRRTVKQWLTVADEIGKRIANKSNAEIEQIAYKSWFDIEPSKSITQYDSQLKTSVAFQKFTSDEWVNTINNAVNETRKNNSLTNDITNTIAVENNKEFLTQSYQYEKSDNAKINNLREDASKYFDNSKESHAYIDMLEKIITDKDIDIRLDGELKTPDGRVVNGSYANGTITINPNSNRAGEFIAIHELTHAIGTKEMLNIIENYRKSNAEFDTSVKQLLGNYNSTEITEEALADVSAQLFGNQEFINNVANTNPSFFKKIYNEIKYLWHQFRDYKNQNEFVEDLYNKWTQAYNSSNNLNTTTNYYIETVADFNEIEYNNAKEIKLPKQEYAILSTIINSDSNIKPGINKIETTNAQYEIYFKETGEFKVLDKIANEGEDINVFRRTLSRNEEARSKRFNEQLDSEEVSNKRTGTYNDGISENNSKGTYKRNRSNYDGKTNSRNDINTKYSMQESENNSDSFNISKYDNKGRELSKQQQEYFKDSKVRDKKGNLLTMYHSTDADFNTFTYDNLGKTGLAYGEGFYFTDSEKAKKTYGKNTKTVYLDISKPMEIGKRTMTKNDFKKLVEAVNERTNGQVEADYGNINDALQVYEYGGDDIDLVNELKNESGLSNAEYYSLLRETLGYDGIKANNKTNGEDGNYWIAFNPNQIKNIDNSNPTDNPDIRYSIQKENGSWQKYLENNFKASGTRTHFKDILVQKASNANSYTKTQENKQAQTHMSNELETSEWTKRKKEGEKRRKHYESIIRSNYTTDETKAIAKSLMGTDTYVPESNSKQLELADDRISTTGADSELASLLSRATTGGTIKAEDIAIGERLIQYYSKTGNKTKLQDAIQATAMAGTTAGQTVQAMSLLNHQTPEGQAVWLQRSVDKMNKDLKRTRGEDAEQFKLTPEMLNKITNSENAKVLEQNLNEVYKELGQQVTKTTAQKIDAWRYFSMLANPRTHIRNIVGNTAMGGVQGIKNKVAGGIESAVSKINPDMERNHTVIPASKEVKAFAKADIENVVDRLGLNENKYNPKTRLENNMRTFKSDAMENTIGKAFDLNNKALEAEDGWGLKAGYVKALSEYMTANKLTPDTITDQQLGKARNFAIEQAKEATFHQDSQLASLINQLSNKNKFSKFVLDATLPFKKTPINVAKAGLEYSPVGLVKSAVYDTVQLRKGNITANKYIDNISKGLTGTGIALVGYALANCGVLKATGSDDEDKEKFEEGRGSQNYAITIGNNTYSLDWLAPSGIPLFIGAECYELMKAQKEKKTSSSDEDEYYNKAIDASMNILDSFTNAMNPMTEMSMLSGLTSALKSYDQGSSKMLAGIGTNSIKSYVNQFIPTALGQIAKTTDEYERNTTSTKTGVLPKAIDTTRTQIMNKIPGLRQKLPIKTDIWGQEQKQSDNIALRALENAVFPWARKELNSNNVDKEITKVYESTGESSVFPDTINKNLTIDKKKYVMTSKEFAKYKKQFGETSYELLKNLVNSDGYKKLSDSQKQLAIEKIYSYSTEQVKIDYARQNCLKNEQSTLSQVTNAIKKTGGNTSNYFEFLANTQGLDKDSEKLEVLANSKYDEKTKKAIYENSLGKKDTKYDIVKGSFTGSGLNMSKYLQYKAQEFKADKKDDGTVNGKSITGSKKDKVFDYIDSIKGATYTQKLILYALEYKPSSSSDREIVENYVRNLPNKTAKEKLEIMSKFAGVTLNKPDKEFPDGSYDY